jgi:hypothetical protein
VEREGDGAVGKPIGGEEDDSEFQAAGIQELQTQRGLPSQPHLIMFVLAATSPI